MAEPTQREGSGPVVSIGYSDIASVVSPPPRPGLLGAIDRFEILKEIGRGGMGMVFLARDTQSTSGNFVAIKVLKPEFVRLPRAVHRFLVEARHMSHLAHPNILPVLEVSDRPTGPYFVMPYMERGSLARLIEPGKPLEPALTKNIARDIAEALQFAHSKGITHRDLKSDNVLLDGEGNAYLSDFGLARTVFNDSIVDVREMHREGTAPYMAPEIARGEAGDTRCDIYSWGALLYEMLTGCLPYDGDTPQELIRKIIEAPPTPILTRNPNADTKLAKIAESAMARELRERYAEMGDVVQDLTDEKDPHRRDHPRETNRRSGFVSRNWRRIAWGVFALLVAVGLWWLMFGITLSPNDTFDGWWLDRRRWVKEEVVFCHEFAHPQTQYANSWLENGDLVIESRVEAREGFTATKLAIVDSKHDLKKSGNVEISMTLNASTTASWADVCISDGKSPDELTKPDPALLCRVDHAGVVGVEQGHSDIALRIQVFAEAQIAVVWLGSENAKPHQVVDLSQLDHWFLRFVSRASSSGGVPKDRQGRPVEDRTVLTIRDVRTGDARRIHAVTGRITDPYTGWPIRGAVIHVGGVERDVTDEHGRYFVKLDASGRFPMAATRREYEPMETEVALAPAEVKPLNFPLKQRDTPSANRVVKTYSYTPSTARGGILGFFPDDTDLVYVRLGRASGDGIESRENSYLFKAELSRIDETESQLSGPLQSDTTRGTNKCAPNALIRCDGRYHAIATWPGRLMECDEVEGVIQTSIRFLSPELEELYKKVGRDDRAFREALRALPKTAKPIGPDRIAYPRGLGFEDDYVWFATYNPTYDQPGIHCWRVSDLARVAFVEVKGITITSLAFGNDSVWVSTDDHQVLELDSEILRQTKDFEKARSNRKSFEGHYDILAFADGYLWGLNSELRRIYKVDVKATGTTSQPATE